MNIFDLALIQPLINLLVAFYHIIPDLAFSILVITILIKLVTLPFSIKSYDAQAKMKIVQERIEEIKARHANDKEKQNIEIMNFYKQEKINPFSSCLPLIIQLVILIAFVNVLTLLMKPDFNLQSWLYPFVQFVQINPIAFGFLDLTKTAMPHGAPVDIIGVGLAILAGILQYFQTKMMTPNTPKKDPSQITDKKESQMDQIGGAMNKQMLYFFPVLTIFMGLSFPMGLTYYWVVSTALAIVQQYILIKRDKSLIKVTESNNIIEITKK